MAGFFFFREDVKMGDVSISQMMQELGYKSVRYIGDGVYAGCDGYHVWLVCAGYHGINRIALEPSVYNNLSFYVDRVLKDGDIKP